MLFAGILYEEVGGRMLVRAMPVMLVTLLVLAIAYRYYSAFLAAKVAALDDSRVTPAHELNDGQNYHPTNRWVLFGHHFAAISGAGPLIDPVLAIQFGFFPGLLWLLIGVCLAGAVQDMLVMAASVRRKGKSLAEIARIELGPWANLVTSVAILFIVIIALAGLGIVVVKALGGEEVKLAQGMQIRLPEGAELEAAQAKSGVFEYHLPKNCEVRYKTDEAYNLRSESFVITSIVKLESTAGGVVKEADNPKSTGLPPKCKQIVPGSSWGTFTIACTIPIALFVGLYMYKIRKGAVVEASLIGALGVLAATVIGNWIPGSPLEPIFSLTREQTIWAMVAYGFIASVLPVWMLLCPRDYLSSFLKIGTIGLLVIGVIIANPTLKAPAFNEVFSGGGPTFRGNIFPFVFICVMCGAVSGFHALVASGTTPKMINREGDIRPIGYGAMLIECLVGVVALIAAASLEPKLYFEMNTDLEVVSDFQKSLDSVNHRYAVDPMHRLADIGKIEHVVGGESLRGRTGGAVTLAVGMAVIFEEAMDKLGMAFEGVIKYWFHFAIMFEALFILTTIDTGTRIARFLLQEAGGKINPKFAQTDWLPSAILSTALVTGGWGLLISTGSIDTIWPMFGIANQLLAVIALCLVTTLLFNSGRGRYAWVTLMPMVFVITTTMTAAASLVTNRFPEMIRDGQAKGDSNKVLSGYLNIAFTVFVVACVLTLLVMSVSRWLYIRRYGATSSNGDANVT